MGKLTHNHNHNTLSRSVPGTHSCEPLTGIRSWPLEAVGLSASATNKQRRYDTLCAVQELGAFSIRTNSPQQSMQFPLVTAKDSRSLSQLNKSTPGLDHKIFLQKPPRGTILRNTYPMIVGSTLFNKCRCNILDQSISPSRFWPAYRPAALRKPLQ